ncbi:MAG TPA: hypothetical protein PKW18_03400 [Candidatus Sumerlaeota bacterium]|nr:hypothetical protein [Candidatus Sumerlaeota bacterium]HRR99495.1 hypothetical protein [Candidatus Sumerlaeia bacterium]HON50423.1 hypothetical protein [Candidatus Sumerlaeota bacterium]HOR63639.1 hypothetical protein [Candidatus Sumerlaeota bacterium]HPL73606.1 hypothetical protein [Candidatus Sumerlaeota bacterium]
MKKGIVYAAVLLTLVMALSGCSYFKNRYYDFRDITDLEVGATFAKPKNGSKYLVPHALGAYVEATQFMQLGALGFNNMDTVGGTAGLDLRSSWAGKESRTRYGFGPWQKYVINQEGWLDDYKAESFEKHGIDLCYRDNVMQGIWRRTPYLRGRNYWEYIGGEFAISEPFLSHFGIKIRAGFDPCQVMDFILGWTTLDIYGDDLEDRGEK